MKNQVANSDRIFVDRPLNKQAVARSIPSLWMLSKDGTDYVETTLRVFLMLCLLASLAVCGLKVNRTPEIRPNADFGMSAESIRLHPALPSVSLGLSIR